MSARILYGNDYVDYDDSVVIKKVDVGKELDLMLLEMDDDNGNPFNEEIEPEDNLDEEDEFLEEETDQNNFDTYEFDDVDPEIFKDPTLMVKWLKKVDG